MNLKTFMSRLKQEPEALQFSEVIELIESLYRFTPTAFRNGTVSNSEDQNQGSCKVFSFAQIHQLDQQQTLHCFAEHYRAVEQSPDGDDHANIRQFMQNGWDGIEFDGQALTPLSFTDSSISFM
jgi:hypothetical protein